MFSNASHHSLSCSWSLDFTGAPSWLDSVLQYLWPVNRHKITRILGSDAPTLNKPLAKVTETSQNYESPWVGCPAAEGEHFFSLPPFASQTSQIAFWSVWPMLRHYLWHFKSVSVDGGPVSFGEGRVFTPLLAWQMSFRCEMRQGCPFHWFSCTLKN